jgi:hypothetical protein
MASFSKGVVEDEDFIDLTGELPVAKYKAAIPARRPDVQNLISPPSFSGVKRKRIEYSANAEQLAELQTLADTAPLPEADAARSKLTSKLLELLTCAICFENYASNEPDKTMFTTSCGHVFHKKCIMQCNIRKPTCPVCSSHITAVHAIYI